MPYDEVLADRVRTALGKRKGLTEKKMFGGLGFLLSGNMCVGVWKEYLILRLGPDDAPTALREPHTRPFDITGKPLSGWVMVEPTGTATDAAVRAWVRRAVEFVRTLPAKG
jgi:hypothetical protein